MDLAGDHSRRDHAWRPYASPVEGYEAESAVSSFLKRENKEIPQNNYSVYLPPNPKPKTYPMSIMITCIKKDSGHHESHHTAISDFGWTNEATGENGSYTRDGLFDYIKQ